MTAFPPSVSSWRVSKSIMSHLALVLLVMSGWTYDQWSTPYRVDDRNFSCSAKDDVAPLALRYRQQIQEYIEKPGFKPNSISQINLSPFLIGPEIHPEELRVPVLPSANPLFLFMSLHR